VLARGIVGDGEIVVASPVQAALCAGVGRVPGGSGLRVRVFAARVEQETVSVHAAP
jgi:hypothetical protein